jgi:TRAP-type C4-dicarboxylate transport system substrate-binding protein
MKGKLRTCLIATVCAVVLLCAGAVVPTMAQELTVRFAWYMPPHTATADQGIAVAEKIQSLSHGKIKVETYPSGSLLKESNLGEGLTNNTVNLGIGAMHWWSKQEPSL